MKRLLAVAVALLPAATALAAVRPVQAEAPQGFGSFGLTVTAAAVHTDGVVGASGGLVTLDAGVGFASGRLDAAPSSYALGAPVEPGTLARTVVGQVNTQAGTTVLTVPDAESAYPGRASASTEYAPAQAAGPLAITPGRSSSSASETSSQATSTGSALAVTGVAQASQLDATSVLSGDSAKGQGFAKGVSQVGTLDVAGVLVLHDLRGTAQVDVTGGRPVATSTLTVGSATVAGVPVTVDQDGVHAAGQGTGLGPVTSGQKQVDDALAAAGLSVRTVAATRSVDTRSGYADTGGLAITLATPDLPAGVAANVLTFTVGKVTVTGTSTAAEPPLDLGGAVGAGGGPVVPGVTTTTVTVGPGTTGPPAAPTALPAPTVARSQHRVLLAGHAVPAAAALAAFGVWQLLTMSTMTLYAFVDRRRRLEEAA